MTTTRATAARPHSPVRFPAAFRATSRGRQATRLRGFGLMVLALAAVLVGHPASALAAPGSGNEATWRDQPDSADMRVDTTRQGTRVPLDLPFTDETGESVTLANYLNGDRPVILTLGYFRCPKLCNVLLNGLVDTLQKIDLVVGKDFDLITVSIHPDETPELAAVKKTSYLAMLGNASAAPGWHFLTGPPSSTHALADSVGWTFRARRQPDGALEYDHGAALMILTPDGELSRYLLGIEFVPRTLHLSLIEAGKGKISASVYDQLALYCYHFDPTTGTYTAQAFRIMQIGGLLTVVILGIVVGSWWLRELRAGARASATSTASDPTADPPAPGPDSSAGARSAASAAGPSQTPSPTAGESPSRTH